jgi:hypothetical protein
MSFDVKKRPLATYQAVYYDGDNLMDVIAFCLQYTSVHYDPGEEEAQVKIGDRFVEIREGYYYVSTLSGSVEMIHPTLFDYEYFRTDKYEFKLEEKHEE